MADSNPGRHGRVVWVCPQSLIDGTKGIPVLSMTRELRNLGWEVALISAGPDTEARRVMGVETLCVRTPDRYFVKQVVFHLRAMAMIARDFGEVDVLFFNQISLPYMLPFKLWRALAGRRHPVLLLDTRTVPMELKEKATVRDRLRAGFTNAMNWLGNRTADGQTAITERMVEAVRIPRRRLWGVWPSATDVEPFAPAVVKRVWPGEEEAVRLIYIGILHYERNLITLCQAAEQANKEGMRFTLTFVGDGTEREDLERFAAAHDWVEVIRPVPHAQIPDILAGAHVGVIVYGDLPQFRVSSPIKLFEYLAAGMPVMATRMVCHTEVVGDAPFMIWVEQTDSEGIRSSLREVWEKRAELAQMGAEAAAAAGGFTWRVSAEKLSRAIEHGLQQNGQKEARGVRSSKEGMPGL